MAPHISDDRPPQIVIVEDDAEVRRSLTLMLRARGYAIDAYRNASELLSARLPFDPACYLIDYKMPLIDGIELLRRLRRSGMTAPALLLTGYFSASLTDRAHDAGFNAVVQKPTQESDLMEQMLKLTMP